MAKYRVQCPNRKCNHIGMLDGHSDKPYIRKSLLAQTEGQKKRVFGMGIERMQFRCPKCGTRWRMRTDQVH